MGKEVGPIWFVLRLFQLPQQGLQEEATEVARLLLAAPSPQGAGAASEPQVSLSHGCGFVHIH